MKSLQSSIDQMNQLFKELIQIATQLRDLSFQVISEEELAPLQKRQEELLAQLESVDQQIQEQYRHQLDAATQESIHQQLHTFQQLNQEFIQNLNTSQGLIQFELRRVEEEETEDFSHLSRLNKMSPSLDHPETLKPEDKEES